MSDLPNRTKSSLRSFSESNTSSTRTSPKKNKNSANQKTKKVASPPALEPEENEGNKSCNIFDGDTINLEDSTRDDSQILNNNTSSAEEAGPFANLLNWAKEKQSPKMEEQMADLLVKLAQSQLRSEEEAQRRAAADAANAQRMADAEATNANSKVLNSCVKLIIPFKKENVPNFLKAVEACCREFNDHPERIAKVLEYAKLRVDNDVLITETTFETFEDFKRLITARYLKTQSHTQLMSQLVMARQGRAEKTKVFADRVEALKEEYCRALKTDYVGKGKVFSVDRIDEAERTATGCFMTGLNDDVRKHIRGDPDIFSDAVAMALAGEQANELNKKADIALEQSKPYAPTTNAYRGNARQNPQQRGGYRGNARGYNRGYQGANSYYNRASNYQQSAAASGQQQDGKVVAVQNNGGGPDVAGSSNNYNRPRGAAAPQMNKGCFECGDLRHKAVDCTRRAARVATVEQFYDNSNYYDDRGFDQTFDHEQVNWRSQDDSSKNEDMPQHSTCSAAQVQTGQGHYTQ